MNTEHRIILSGRFGKGNIDKYLRQLIWDSLYDSEIIIDLSTLTFITPVVLTSLAAYIKYVSEKGGLVKLELPNDPNMNNYLGRMDFFENLEINMSYPFIRHNGTGKFQELYHLQNEEDIKLPVENIKAILQQSLTEELIEIMDYALYEILENIFRHAQSSSGGFVAAQAYPLLGFLEVAITDTGIGIAESLRENPLYVDKNTLECLKLAIEPKITSKSEEHSGEGLYFSSEIVKLNKGTFCIFSQDGKLCLQNETENIEKSSYWQGAIVVFSLKLPFEATISLEDLFNERTNSNHELLEEL